MATALVRVECANDTWSTVHDLKRVITVEWTLNQYPQAFLMRIAVAKSPSHNQSH